MVWTSVQRAFAVEAFIRNNESVIMAQREFRTRFQIPPRHSVPDRKSIVLWVNNFRETGNVVKKRGGRPRSARTPENINAVRQSVVQSPQRSARKHAAALRMSDRSVRRILHMDLYFHPYKMVVVQELSQRDWQSRTEACEIILENLPPDAVVFFSDEAHFHLCGSVNKQNFRYWSENNPQVVYEKPLHSERVTVWCALSRRGIIGPHFFEEDGNVVTVNSNRYADMISEFFGPALQQRAFENVWFQQDGATAHTARISMDILRQMFPGRLISRGGDIVWPARSPDLTPCDFFLWGYIKAEVFKHRPRNLQDLKRAICEEVQRIPQAMLERVHASFRIRLQNCIDNHGHHLPDILFKTK